MSLSVAATFVFTDLVDSTAIAARLDPGSAEELRQVHFGLLRSAVSATGGTEVKNLGDGLMVVFSSPSRALACAAAMQQALHAHAARSQTPLSIRVGVATGEATEEDGDYFGMPVIEASRLCAAARSGQILATDLVRLLVGRNASQEMVPVGALELKGLPEAVEAVEVLWEPEEASRADAWPLPARLVQGATESLFGFFGRDEELAEIAALVKRTVAEPRVRLLWVSGEPGIGKTTLVSQVTRAAHASVAKVALGACDEGSPVPFLPWIAVARQVAAHTDAISSLSTLHRQALARLVPELGGAASDDTDVEQFVLFEAVANMLEFASADEPLIVVLDDVHWADNASLDLVRHLVTRAAPMRVLIIATFRDSDLSRGDPLSRLIADMHREQSASRIALDGLSDVELMSLMAAAAGHELEDDGVRLAHALRRETDGNPFFIAEMLRHLDESGEIYLDERNRYVLRTSIEQLGLPTSVRDVVARRVERLGDEAIRVLTTAAVIGREFAVDVLALVAEVGEDSLLDLLEAAVGGAVLTEPADRPGRFRFAHGLIQHTLYNDLGATRRQRLHARVAQVLEQRSGGGDGDVPELARHWLAATRPAEKERALHYTRRAGDLALESLAPRDGARWYRQGLELLDRDGDADDPARGAFLVGLGRAQQMLGDDEYTATLLAAADLADRLGDRDLLIAAALAPARGVSTGSETEHALLTVTQRALSAIGEDNTPERVRLLTTLTEQTDARDWRTARDRAFAAIDAARKLGDERLAAEAVTATFLARSQPDTLEEQLRDTAEAVATADRLGDPILQFHARHSRGFALIELGDIEAADQAVEEMEQLLGGSRVPLMRYTLAVDESARQMHAADFPAAEAAADDALTVMTEAGYPDALAVYGGLLFTIRREQGRLDEIADLFIDAARDNPGLAVLRAAVGIVHCERDDLDGARASFAGDDESLDSFPYDFTWMSAMTNLADVAVALGDRDAAERILRRLEPYANQNVAVAGVCAGSASRPIARLQALLGNDDIADAAFAYALEHNRQLAAPFWIAHTELDYAQALSARGGVEGDQVAALVRSAIDAAREYGFAGLERRAHAILAND